MSICCLTVIRTHVYLCEDIHSTLHTTHSSVCYIQCTLWTHDFLHGTLAFHSVTQSTFYAKLSCVCLWCLHSKFSASVLLYMYMYILYRRFELSQLSCLIAQLVEPQPITLKVVGSSTTRSSDFSFCPGIWFVCLYFVFEVSEYLSCVWCTMQLRLL